MLADPSTDPWLRRLFVLSSALALLWAATLLLPGPSSAVRFAWTIASPQTAALFGAWSLAAALVIGLAGRRKAWTDARIGLPFAAVLGWTLLGVTGLHLDELQLEPAAAGRGLAWSWLAAVLLLPALQLGLGLAQWRRPGSQPARRAPMGRLARAAAVPLALALALPGTALLLRPGLAALVWPFAAGPLDARVLGAGLLGAATLAAQVALEGDWLRVQPALTGLLVAALLTLALLLPEPPQRVLPLALGTGLVALLAAAASMHALRSRPAPRRASRATCRLRVGGRVDEVAAVLRDAPGYQRWWPAVCSDVQVMLRGDAQGVGELARLRVRGPLPGVAQLRARVVSAACTPGLRVQLDGDLRGDFEWRLSAQGPWVDVSAHWQVEATRPLWRSAARLLPPLWRAQQRWAMRRAEAGLRLELVRRRAPAAERRRLPAAPPPLRGLPARLRAGAELFRRDAPPLRLTQRVLIERGLREVFEFAADLGNDPLWRDGVSVQSAFDEPMPLALGQRFGLARRVGRRMLRHGLVLTSLEPLRHVAFESLDGRCRVSREFETQDGVTLVSETEEFVLPWLLRPLVPWLSAEAARLAAADYGRLARLLEQLNIETLGPEDIAVEERDSDESLFGALAAAQAA